MQTLEKSYLNYINENLEQLKKEITLLTSENKKDEANLIKIKTNIFDIFKTLFNVDKNQVKNKKDLNNEECYNLFCTSYLKRFDTIPENWRISLKNAKDNGDVVNQVIEETKLSIADELKNKFLEISKLS